jgi:hypothetical protein
VPHHAPSLCPFSDHFNPVSSTEIFQLQKNDSQAGEMRRLRRRREDVAKARRLLITFCIELLAEMSGLI